MGKVEDRQSGGGRGRKRGSATKNLGVAGLPFFNGEDACQPYEKGHPIGMGVYVDDTHRGGGRGRQRLIPRRR